MTQSPNSETPISSPSKKSESRIAAIEALYVQQMNDSKKAAPAAIKDILHYYQEKNQSHLIKPDFITLVVKGVVTHQTELDQLITARLMDNWRFERLTIVLQCILRAAAFELAHQDDTPYKVIIDEYTEISHYFCDEKEASFVNGILDNIASHVRDTPKIRAKDEE